MRKRTVALFVLLAALVGLAVSQVFSYTLAQQHTENIITYGSLKMELLQLDEDGQSIPLHDDEAVRLIADAGETPVYRDISVKNICDQPMYLRLKLSVTGQDQAGNTFSLNNTQARYTVQSGWLSRPRDDGWYYYEEPLQPHQLTKSLLTGNTVTFLDTKALAKEHPGLTLHIEAQVQAVQSVHNPEEGDVFAAQGWPEEVTEP